MNNNEGLKRVGTAAGVTAAILGSFWAGRHIDVSVKYNGAPITGLKPTGERVNLPGGNNVAPEVTVEPTVTPAVESTPAPEVVETAKNGFLGMLNDVVYPWVGSVTNPETPFLFDAQSTGLGVTKLFDIGVKEGQVAVLKGYSITLFDETFGEVDKNGCAGPVILTPGYYYGVEMTDARWEVYDLPLADAAGWVKVLGEQAAVVENTEYGCLVDPTSQMPVFGTDQVAPNFNK